MLHRYHIVYRLLNCRTGYISDVTCGKFREYLEVTRGNGWILYGGPAGLFSSEADKLLLWLREHYPRYEWVLRQCK